MITSADNSKIKEIIKLQKKKSERDKKGVFIVEGLRSLETVPGDRLISAFCSDVFADKNQAFLRNFPIEVVSEKVYLKMTDTETPQGMLAVVKKKEINTTEILERAKTRGLVLFLENLRDPGNLGTILRTAEAAGVTGIIMSKGTTDIYNPKVVRSTMGSIYRVPYAYSEDFFSDIRQAGEFMKVYAARGDVATPYFKEDFTKETGFVIGNEATGISKELLELLPNAVSIPMCGEIESLNAGIAAGVLCFEAVRQRSI